MKYVEAPSVSIPERPALFLAGGITGCPPWQTEAVALLADVPRGTILNPRRKNFPIHDPNAAEAQITWEYQMLHKADVILFWFCADETQPIVLYELGRYAAIRKPIVVGVDPAYPRRQDVEIQLKLARPEVTIHRNFSAVITHARLKLWEVER